MSQTSNPDAPVRSNSIKNDTRHGLIAILVALIIIACLWAYAVVTVTNQYSKPKDSGKSAVPAKSIKP